MSAAPSPKPGERLADKPSAWVELALTLPIFLGYHVGVVFLRMQNATDIVTGPLLQLAEGSRAAYVGITAGIGLVLAGVFALLGRGQAFRPRKFVQIAAEGVVYALAMQVAASYVVGRLFAGNVKSSDAFTGLVMSLGAGFYEEIAFRVLLFGVGLKIIHWLFFQKPIVLFGPRDKLEFRGFVIGVGWALAAACLFSAVHYVGSFRDTFELQSFVFRAVLGLALTLIYTTRGFAAAVWTHALYDVWVLVLPHA